MSILLLIIDISMYSVYWSTICLCTAWDAWYHVLYVYVSISVNLLEQKFIICHLVLVVNCILEQANLILKFCYLLFILLFLLCQLDLELGRLFCEYLNFLIVLLDCFIFDRHKLSQRQLILLELFHLVVVLCFKSFLFLLKSLDISFKVICEKLQLVLDWNMLSNISLVLLKLLLQSYAILLCIHAGFWDNRGATRFEIATKLGQCTFSDKLDGSFVILAYA